MSVGLWIDENAPPRRPLWLVMHPRRRATLIGLLALLLWSSLAALTTATAGIPPFELLALTFGVGGIVGVAGLALRGRAALATLRQPLGAQALTIGALFGYHALYFIALKRAPAVEANLINYLWPLLIVVFAAMRPGVHVRVGQWLGTLLGLVAVVLIVTRGERLAIDVSYASGYVAAFCAAIVWAAYSVANRRNAHVPSASILGACVIVAVLGAIAHALFETTVTPTHVQLAVIVAMGLGPIAPAFIFWDFGTKHGEIALLGTLSYATPVASTALLLAIGRGEAHWTIAAAVVLLTFGAWLGVRSAAASASDRPLQRDRV